MSQHLLGSTTELRVEPTERRVRALADGSTVADTTGAMLVWEPRRVVPMYAVPLGDVRAELVPHEPPAPGLPGASEPIGPGSFAAHTCPGQAYTVRVAGRELAAAAFRPDDSDLAAHVLLDFSAFSWFEETEPLVGHPHDPFKRIDILRADRHVVVALDGVVLADSTRATALFETLLPTRWYLPRDDVRLDLLAPSDTRTTCAYKGHASYFSVVDAGVPGRDLAWTYEEPLAEAEKVRGLVSFFTERSDLTLDGLAVERPVTFWSATRD